VFEPVSKTRNWATIEIVKGQRAIRWIRKESNCHAEQPQLTPGKERWIINRTTERLFHKLWYWI